MRVRIKMKNKLEGKNLFYWKKLKRKKYLTKKKNKNNKD